MHFSIPEGYLRRKMRGISKFEEYFTFYSFFNWLQYIVFYELSNGQGIYRFERIKYYACFNTLTLHILKTFKPKTVKEEIIIGILFITVDRKYETEHLITVCCSINYVMKKSRVPWNYFFRGYQSIKYISSFHYKVECRKLVFRKEYFKNWKKYEGL